MLCLTLRLWNYFSDGCTLTLLQKLTLPYKWRMSGDDIHEPSRKILTIFMRLQISFAAYKPKKNKTDDACAPQGDSLCQLWQSKSGLAGNQAFKSLPCCSTRHGGLVKSSDLHLSTWEVRVLTPENSSRPLAAAFRLKLLLCRQRIPVCNQAVPLSIAAPFHPWNVPSRCRYITVYLTGLMQNKARVKHHTSHKTKASILLICTLMERYNIQYIRI